MCVSEHVLFTVGYMSHHSNMPCLHLHTMHVFQVRIVSAAYTDNSRGNKGSRDLFIHLDM